MSSPPPLPFSPGNESTIERRSKFTYKQLAHLAASSTTCPLRVIAHIDLDAFYAQCEMVRLGIREDQPLAVQQWCALPLSTPSPHSRPPTNIYSARQGLIAINYPARKSGLSRHVNVVEAKKLCPNIICQHVATWREGDEKWAYHDNAFANIATHKVSLDPYRLECRKILACIKDTLPKNCQKVEKASIDEVFLDLSAQIHSILLERYPELAQPLPNSDVMEYLPMPPTTALEWQADALVDLDSNETEEDDPDWDDVATLIGSEIVRKVRAAIREQLNYTCSAGIAQNKMVAKLGSAYKKPNQQTVIRPRAIQRFLSEFKFTKIRSFGGKLGDEIVAAFGTEFVKDLLGIPLAQLRQKLGDDTGTRVYQLIRGIDHSEVNPRTVLKSMLSAKSFRPTINTEEQAVRWLRIFVADIYSRLVEEGVLENKRRPNTIHLHYRCSGQDRSKSVAIPAAGTLTKEILLELAQKLLMMGIVEGNIWPCANLSLSVSGFEEGITGNMGIGAFLVKGKAENEKLKDAAKEKEERGRDEHEVSARPEKRRKTEMGGGSIQRFFGTQQLRQESTGGDTEVSREHNRDSETPRPIAQTDGQTDEEDRASTPVHRVDERDDMHSEARERTERAFMCSQCDEGFDSAWELQSHQDWHFAKSLQEEEAKANARRPIPAAFQSTQKQNNGNGGGSSHRVRSSQRPKASQAKRKERKDDVPDSSGKTQSRLTFG